MKSPVELLSSYLDDVERLEPGVKGLNRDLLTIEARFKHEGYGFLSIALSTLCDAFDTGLATGCFTCPTNFAKVRGGSIPKFLQGLICKVFDSKTGLLLNIDHVHAVKCVRGLLRMFKKVQLSPRREELLHKEAVLGFIETDNSILSNSFDKSKVNLLRDVSRLVLSNLDQFDSENLIMKHGPGGVEERAKTNQKWQVLLDSCQRDSFLAVKYGLDIIASDSGDVAHHHGIEPLSFQDMLYYSDQLNGLIPQRSMSGIAKLLSVPKSCVARRTITMEPTLNMFIQQGLNTVLRDSIKDCSILRWCLALTDQTKNQNLALIGSRTSNYATIDLSSASDLLDLDVVKIVFATKPKFLTSALDCRSSHCRTDFGVVELRKFAGMGNALTFPIQSIVFALLAICGVLCCEGKRPSFGNVKRAAQNIQIFGDDIIIKTEYSNQVIDWLTSFGLRVNQKKSFLEGNFRESCGVDAYHGFDVTPVYVRHEPVITARNPEQLASLVSSSNQAWLQGLYKMATTLANSVNREIRLPIVSKSSAALGWHTRVDSTIATKWDRKLQRLVFRGFVIEPLLRPDRINGYAALAKSLHMLDSAHIPEPYSYRERPWLRALSRDAKHLERSVLRFNTKLRKRWVPASIAG